LGRVKNEINKFQEEFNNFVYFSKMFSFEEATEGAEKNLNIIINEHQIMLKLWNHIEKCQN